LYGAKNMNMISTGAFLTEMDASNKQPTVAEKFAAVWEKKNAKAARAGGVSLMALSLAACGGSSSTTTTTTDTTTDTTTTTPVVDAAVSAAATAAIDTLTGGNNADTFTASGTVTSIVLNDLDTISGGDGADKLSIADNATSTTAAANAYTLPTGLNMTSVETIELARVSDHTGDTITVQADNYADVDTVVVANAGTDITRATVTGEANVQSVTISGGTGADITAVTVTDNATAASATVANTDAITTISLSGVTGAATLASDSLTSLTLKNVAGVATNTDDYIVSTDTRELTVTHNGGTNGGATDAGATTVNVNVDAATTSSGTNTFAAATTLNVDVNATHTAGAIVAAAATDVNVNLDAAVTAMTLTTAAATAMDFTGTANATVTQTAAATAVITNGGTGNLTLNTAIAAGQTYTGGAGVDTVTFAATGTKASTLGAGNDVATFSAVAGTGGSVDAGDGTDTVSLTAALAVSLSSAATFEADIANFEKVTIGAIADSGAATDATISMANLDDINYVILAGATAETGGAATTTISGLSTGATFEQTALLGTDRSVALTGSFTGGSDVVNVVAKATDGFANAGALTIASVETVNITTNDSDTTAATVMFDLNMDAVNATTINVSGDAGITFANSSYTALTTMDASGVTATGAAGVVTFTANATATTIKGGAGNDVLTGGSQNDTITGNAGTDTIVGNAGDDTINGGAGADTITGGDGTDVITGGAGNDTFILTIGETSTSADTITDYTSGDIIEIEADANVAGAGAAGTNATTDVQVASGGKVTFAAADDTLAEKVAAIQADTTDIAANEVVFFEHAGNTYIFGENALAATTDDFYVILEGVTGMTTLTESTTTAGDFTIA